MPEVIVIVVPNGQPEDRGRRRRRRMYGAVQIEERRVCKLLPALLRANQANTTLPKFSPCRAVLVAQRFEAIEFRFGDEAASLIVRLIVHHAANDAGDLLEAIT